MSTNTEVMRESVQHWRHRIQLPDGTMTPGSQDTISQLPHIGLPEDLSGKTVLDIGCSDGFFSFECEKRGAARVLAVDNFSSVYIDTAVGFHAAKEQLDSSVEYMEADLFDLTPHDVGKFDIVLFLGVLYHLRYPLLALDRLASLCNERIIVETEIASKKREGNGVLARILGNARKSAEYMEFLEYDSLNHDPTSWWRQSPNCVEAMLRSCGFCGVSTFGCRGNRGVFHGFCPQKEEDVQNLVSRLGVQVVREAYESITGQVTCDDDIESTLRSLSIAQFGALKQHAYELEGKRWHQFDRWST